MRFALNGKNRFGGYVGERPYYAIVLGGTLYVNEGTIEVDERTEVPKVPAR